MERVRLVVRDEYEVIALLGYGGMAGVFLARERRLRRRVALKVMSPEMMLQPNMVERFHQEAVTQANLEHPSIAAVYGVREQRGLHFFAMQFVPGRTLRGALNSELDAGRAMEFPAITTLLHQIGSALEYAHGAGVIHRDVKPGNVLLGADGHAVVTDFGIAKVAEGPALSMVSMVQGTAAYMSPEQCYAAELTGASDQYSLGALAYELVSGRVPFSGDGFSVMQAHVGTEPTPLESLRADCPSELATSIRRMMAKQPSDRFPTIASALESMGASGLSPLRDDPVRRELIRLAACDTVMQGFTEEVRASFRTPWSVEAVSGRNPTPPAVASYASGLATAIEIEPFPAVLALGEHVRLRARCRDASGLAIQDAVVWEVDSPHVATVDAAGNLVARSWGRARVQASAGSASAEQELIVGTVPLRNVDVNGVPKSLVAGSTTTIAVPAIDMAGHVRTIPVQIESNDARVLDVDAPATLRAVAPGVAELTVRCGSVTQRTSVRVTSARA